VNQQGNKLEQPGGMKHSLKAQDYARSRKKAVGHAIPAFVCEVDS